MTNDKRFILALALTCTAYFAHAATPAPSPLGVWRVEDGSAHIHIISCGKTLWGEISWEKSPGNDAFNPDAAKQKLPTLGLPILRDMKESKDEPTHWDGEIYNAENGKIYDGFIELTAHDTLHIEGCLLRGIACGGEDWTRVNTKPDKSLTNAAICKRALAK
ncbi:MAG: DUF2147 domain-containing protein [Rickettsiales bacterium]